MPYFMRIMNSIPGYFGVSIQVGIFQSDLGGGRSVDINISGENIDTIVAGSRAIFGAARAENSGLRSGRSHHLKPAIRKSV